MDFAEEPLPEADSARMRSGRLRPPMPREPTLRKLRRERPSQFLAGPPLKHNISIFYAFKRHGSSHPVPDKDKITALSLSLKLAYNRQI
jgi:hypothetical protein